MLKTNETIIKTESIWTQNYRIVSIDSFDLLLIAIYSVLNEEPVLWFDWVLRFYKLVNELSNIFNNKLKKCLYSEYYVHSIKAKQYFENYKNWAISSLTVLILCIPSSVNAILICETTKLLRKVSH